MRRRPFHVSAVFGLVAAALWLASSAAAAAGDLEGTVFDDRNHNGVLDAGEPGLQGVRVVATAVDGTVIGPVTTDGDGRYTLSTADAGDHRIEFSLPDDLVGFEPGPLPADGTVGVVRNGSTVQFASANGPLAAGAAGIDVGFARPWTFCQAAPELASNCYVQGDLDGPVLITVPWAFHAHLDGNPDGGWAGQSTPQAGTPSAIADNAEIGTTWGIGWNPNTTTIYAAAYLKRKARFGPDGPAAIYQNVGGVTSLFVDLSDHLGPDAAGTDPHPLDATVWIDDEGAVPLVGKMSLGDVEVSADGSTLHAVNLHDRSLVSIPLDGTPISAATIEVTPVPVPANCDAADLRPFALGVDRVGDGALHVGAVCSAQSTGAQADLRGYVWQAADDGSFDLLLDHPLHPRPGGQNDWVPWDDDVPSTAIEGAKRQPMLTDIEFDDVGLLIGLRDRWGDQTPGSGLLPNEAPWPRGNGDTIRTCWQADTLIVESDGSCGAVTNLPGAGEFFFRDDPGDDGVEGMVGGLAIRPGDDLLISTSYDSVAWQDDYTPITDNFNTGGVTRLDTGDGNTLGAYDFFRNGNDQYFGKASGVGDVELLCDAAPVQIGDRVWFDGDGDGAQDPEEPGIAGVVVTLRAVDGTALASTTTDGDGRYSFGIAAGVDHLLTFDAAAATGLPDGLSATDLTPTDADGARDEIDSDATLIDGTTTITVPARAAGQNDHTLDVGFTTAETHRLGNLVWLDLDADGTADPGEPGIAGVTVQVFADDDGVAGPSEDDRLIATVDTDGDGHYLVAGLSAGDHWVRVPADQSTAADPDALVLVVSSPVGEEDDPDDDGDNNDNGVIVDGDGVTSGVITLGADEPVDEVLRDGSALDDDADGHLDDRSNLTVDFGFVRLAGLGDLVWSDLDGDCRQDPDEPPLDGIDVHLLVDTDADGLADDRTGDGVLTIADALASTTTERDGSYEFLGLEAGRYVVWFDGVTLPDRTTLTGPDGCSDPARDSNADPATGHSDIVSLALGQYDPTIDAGVRPLEVDLTITKTLDGDTSPDGTAIWSITVTNLGPDRADGPVVVSDDLPDALTGIDAVGDGWDCATTPSLVTCVLDGALAAGASSAPIRVRTAVDPDNTAVVVNPASVSTADGETDLTNNDDTASLIPPAEVLGGTARPEPDVEGDELAVTGIETGSTVGLAAVLGLVGFLLVAVGPRLRR